MAFIRKLIWLLLANVPLWLNAQDSLSFRGQLSGFLNYSNGSDLPLAAGARFIPQANYGIALPSEHLLDFEFSASLGGHLLMDPFDRHNMAGTLKPYRAWTRYSGKQFEVRAGLQKINFGSATMLRPLMWFDLLDPRDPLQLTDGVYGLMGRYYTLTNANLWFWILYGNQGQRAWQATETSRGVPEIGGRLQLPVGMGEVAATFHHRNAEALVAVVSSTANPNQIQENRIGFDGKWDLGVGVWFETTWLGRREPQLLHSHQHLLTVGADYTFSLGNGLTMMAEHLEMAVGPNPFSFDVSARFTAFSTSYPVALNHHLTAIVYRDWNGKNQYHFLNWRIQFSRLQLFCMAFWNPHDAILPQQGAGGQMFAGRGAQLMLVYNY